MDKTSRTTFDEMTISMGWGTWKNNFDCRLGVHSKTGCAVVSEPEWLLCNLFEDYNADFMIFSYSYSYMYVVLHYTKR